MHCKNGAAGILVRVLQLDNHVETARSQQCRVYQFKPVGSSQHYYARAPLDTIHLREQLGDHAIAYLSIYVCPAAAWGKGVEFIEEDYAGRGLLCPPEDLSYTLLRFTDPLRKQLRPLNRDETRLTLIG